MGKPGASRLGNREISSSEDPFPFGVGVGATDLCGGNNPGFFVVTLNNPVWCHSKRLILRVGLAWRADRVAGGGGCSWLTGAAQKKYKDRKGKNKTLHVIPLL
jgi:hypothetical protein